MTDLAEQIAAAVDAAFATYTAEARKGGRRPEWPYVPIVRITDPTAPYGGGTSQVKGLAYATRDEAVDAARRQIDAERATLAAKLADPTHRALREYHGLPRDIGPTSMTIAEWQEKNR